MAEKPVLVIALDAAKADLFTRQIALLRTRHKSAKLILLTSAELADRLEKPVPVDEIWPEGHMRGAFRLLALLRRISWAGVSDIYDLEQNRLTSFVRLSVWPRPRWHKGSVLPVS